MHEDAVTAAAHVKRDGLIHGFVLDAVGIVGIENDPLAALVELGEGFAAAEYFFVGRQAEHGGKAGGVVGGSAYKGKRKQRGKGFTGILHVHRMGQKSALGITQFDMERRRREGNRAEAAGVAVRLADFFVFPAGAVLLGGAVDQHQGWFIGLDLEAGDSLDTESARRDEFKGKGQFGRCGIFDRGEFVGLHGAQGAQHVIEGLPGGVLMTQVADFAPACGGVEINELVGAVIGVGKTAEIAADIDHFVQEAVVFIRRINRHLGTRGFRDKQTQR